MSYQQIRLSDSAWLGSLIVRGELVDKMSASFDGLKKKDSSEQSIGDFL